jgi:hypothetical protein
MTERLGRWDRKAHEAAAARRQAEVDAQIEAMTDADMEYIETVH